MTILAVRLPWGRFHATPWDRHVNEAAVEWPPSLWRILRALYATWQWRADWLDDGTVTSLLHRLASPPSFLLPPATEAHTRHYMPDWTSGPPRKDPQTKRIALRRTDKVIDSFAVTERDAELWIRWDLELSEPEHKALSLLAERLSYLGRAESLCEARALADDASRPSSLDGAVWLSPLGADSGHGSASVHVLCPSLPLNLEALVVETPAMRKARLLQPEGSRWVAYRAPSPAQPEHHVPPPRQVQRPTAVRWAISAPAKPSVTAAVAMADGLRRACQARFGRVAAGGASSTLSGKAEDGLPLEGHGHAHYLADDEDGDGLLDTMIVWAPDGFEPRELQALAACTSLRGRDLESADGSRACQLGLEAVGSIAVAAPRLAGRSRVWMSFTPFAPTRHQRKRQNTGDYVEQQVRLELARRDLPEPDRVEVITRGQPQQPLAFRRYRLNERLRDARRAFAVRLTFNEPVDGPLVLGALSHFGLGVFMPEPDR